MRFLIILPLIILVSHFSFGCDFFDKDIDNTNMLMGKKSQFYDAYKQGKCVLEDALSSLPQEQKEVIANLIAKTYSLSN